MSDLTRVYCVSFNRDVFSFMVFVNRDSWFSDTCVHLRLDMARGEHPPWCDRGDTISVRIAGSDTRFELEMAGLPYTGFSVFEDCDVGCRCGLFWWCIGTRDPEADRLQATAAPPVRTNAFGITDAAAITAHPTSSFTTASLRASLSEEDADDTEQDEDDGDEFRF